MYQLPNFNLDVNLWRVPATVEDPPTLQFKANLSRGSRIFQIPVYANGLNSLTSQMILLCPKLTDIRPSDTEEWRDVVEVPAGSGRYYGVAAVDDTAKGFPNEYRHAELFLMVYSLLSTSGNPWSCPPVPYPLP